MAFDPSTSAHSQFPIFHRQATVNGGVVENGSVPSQTVNPNVPVLERDPSSIMRRSDSAHRDPHGLISYPRKNTDRTHCDGDTGLQRLAANILEEAESQDSYFSDRGRSCNPLWSQMMEELPKSLSHLEIKTQQNHIFPQNHAFHKAFGKTVEQPVSKDFKEFFQQNNGTTANQQFFFNFPNGDRDTNPQNTQKLSSGLPNSRSNCIPQRQQGRPDNMSPYKDGVNGQPMNHFPDFSDVLSSEKEMRSLCLNPYLSQSNAQLISIEQCTPKEFNQQVSSLQSFMAGENNTLSQEDFPNVHRHTVAMHHDEAMAEHCKIIVSAMPSQLGQKFWTEQMEQNGGENSQIVNYHASEDQHGFNPQNTNSSEQSKAIFASLNCPNQYQSKATMHQRNMKQFSKQHIQQTNVKSKIRPPLQDKKRRMHLFGFPGAGVHPRPLTNTDMSRGNEKQSFPQNLYFETLENRQFKRGDENDMIRATNAHMWPVSGSRKTPNITFDSSKLSTRSTRPHGRAASGMDIGNMRSDVESVDFYFNDKGMMTCRGESNYHCNASAMTTSVVMNQGYTVLELNPYSDECNQQWSCLQVEREKTQAVLSLIFPDKMSAPVTNTNISETPSDSSSVDCLLMKHKREHVRVASLLNTMENLGDLSLSTDIRIALIRHITVIRFAYLKRKEEIANMSKHQRQSAHFAKDADTMLMAFALKDLAASTIKLRIALRYALQRTLPKPCRRQEPEQHAARRSPSAPGDHFFYV